MNLTDFEGISTIYIAGPMTGLPEWNREAFNIAERELSILGKTVLSPDKMRPAHAPARITHSQYLEICLAMIRAVECVYFLAGWQNSKGAKIEHEWAVSLGKKIIYQDDKYVRTLPMTPEEIQTAYRDGVSVWTLAELNACRAERIKEVLGVEHLRKEPKSGNRAPVRNPKKIPVQEKISVQANRKRDWRSEVLPHLGIKSDLELSIKYGVSQTAINKYRHELGIPKSNTRRTCNISGKKEG